MLKSMVGKREFWISLLIFNFGWWACAIGARDGHFWIGPLLLPLWIVAQYRRSSQIFRRLLFLLAIAGFGFLCDSILVHLWLFRIPGSPEWAPMWLVAMWVLLGLTFEGSAYLERWPWLFVLAGASSGLLTYIWCDALGILHYSRPLWLSLSLHGLLWAAIMPALFQLRAGLLDFPRFSWIFIWIFRLVGANPAASRRDKL